MEKRTQYNIWYWVAAIVAVLFFQGVIADWHSVAPISYSQFESYLEQGKVASVAVGQDTIAGRFTAPVDGKSQFDFLMGKTNAHREWIYAYTGPVQVLRTKDYLLEARSPLYGKPKGRFYFTGANRFGRGYQRVDNYPKHAAQRAKFEKIIKSLPAHLEEGHPFWNSKLGKRWLQKNPGSHQKNMFPLLPMYR